MNAIARLWALASTVLAVGLTIVFMLSKAWLQATVAVAFFVLGVGLLAWAAVVEIRKRRQP